MEFSMCISRHKWLLQRQNKECDVIIRRTIPVVNQDQRALSIVQYMCSVCVFRANETSLRL